MSPEEYQKISITEFKGLYQRGLNDSCPLDHSVVSQNLQFTRKGDARTRNGSILSLATAANITRMFSATFGSGTIIVLTCDGAGHIYRSDTGGILLTVANMVDFFAINVFSFCLIAPILSTAASNPVYIWSGLQVLGVDAVPIRIAAGVGPGLGMAGVESAFAGNCDIGVHRIGVCFITNTGYTTQPGPLGSPTPPLPENPTFTSVNVTSTGGKCIDLSSIPLGPAGTVSRQIILTQADQNLFFFAAGQIKSGGVLVPWDGVIHDNTTTVATISFFDTDLAVSADSLFDLLPQIPGPAGTAAGMTSYHGRVFFWGGELNLIRVSNPGTTESIDNVAGFIQLPEQHDGNSVTCSSTLQDILYFYKAVGIFSATDNGGDPATWSIINIDAGAGCLFSQSLATINLSTPSQSQNQVNLITDYGGIYLFNGSIVQPPITQKIDGLWSNILQGSLSNIINGCTIAVDPYQKLICLFITRTSSNYPNLLVGDYNDGLNSTDIKWSIWTFPFTISAIGQMTFIDATDTSGAYRLRIASGHNINKIFPGALTDLGSAIATSWKSFYASPQLGAVNIFRFLRARATFTDTINLALFAEDDAFTATPPSFNLPYVNGRDLTREFNFMDEKCAVQLSSSATHGGFILQRVDIFCKPRFNMRPTV